MSIAICPGSFDPITLGHLNIIRRTSRIFDKVIVCVMYNSNKTSPMFSVEERIDMVQRAVYKYPNVTVDSSAGLLAEYAKQFPGAVVVKGLRAASDFEYEFQMALINHKINPGDGDNVPHLQREIYLPQFFRGAGDGPLRCGSGRLCA